MKRTNISVKKNLWNYFCVMMIVLSLFGCATKAKKQANTPQTGGPVAGVDLDTAVKELAKQIDAKLSKGTKVALVSVASPSAAFSEQVLLRLESMLVSTGKVVIVDRANLDKVRAEQGFQLSGEVDDDSAKAIGKLLGAGAIVTGSTVDMGDVYGLALKAIHIETATVAVSYLAELTKTERIKTLMASGGGASTNQWSGDTVQRPAQSSGGTTQATAATTYKIGGKGPAGGFIFYDKENDSGGWRYLEVAPAGNEFKAIWGDIRPSTKEEVGSGKANTQAIAAALQQSGQVSGAARSCTRLNINGYTDWFLPSKDELYWMYVNLKEEGIGGFSGDWYWSSSHYDHWGSNNAKVRRFSDGSQQDRKSWDDTCSVRAVRAF